MVLVLLFIIYDMQQQSFCVKYSITVDKIKVHLKLNTF